LFLRNHRKCEQQASQQQGDPGPSVLGSHGM
jgi:hypothetical protein